MGADPIPFQLIKTEISKPERSINYLISGKKFDWLIFSSGNGVKYFFELLHAEGFDSRLLNGVNIASIGTETAEYLREEGITADFIPSEFSSVSFVKEFPEMYDLSDKRLLRIKGDFTQDTLADGLKSCCAFLESLQVYSIKKETPDNSIKEQLIAKNADAYMFTSGSLVINFFDLFGSETALKLLGNSITMAIGDLTAKALLEKNVEKIIISPVHTIKGMIEMLTQLLTC